METEHKCIKKYLPGQGTIQHGPICLKDIPSASPIHALENEPIQQKLVCL